jgi:hypothetical protein
VLCRVTLSRHAIPFARVPNPNSGNGTHSRGAGQKNWRRTRRLPSWRACKNALQVAAVSSSPSRKMDRRCCVRLLWAPELIARFKFGCACGQLFKRASPKSGRSRPGVSTGPRSEPTKHSPARYCVNRGGHLNQLDEVSVSPTWVGFLPGHEGTGD